MSARPKLIDALSEVLRASGDTPRVAADRLAGEFEALLKEGGREALAQVLREEFSHAAHRLDRVQVTVTGTGWVGSGARAVEQALIELIDQAEGEVLLTVFAATLAARSVWESVKRALQRGVRVTALVNRLSEQDAAVQRTVADLGRTFARTFLLYDFCPTDTAATLHAKIAVADRRVALVGSANLSFSGMFTNHELALVVRGPAAWQVGERIDRLLGAIETRRVLC